MVEEHLRNGAAILMSESLEFTPVGTRIINEAIRDSLTISSLRAGDPRFHALLKEIGDLHDKKQKDYGTSGDPFANVRGSKEWGVPSWVGAMIRANDKMKRLQNFARNGTLANESARDSFMDLAVYSLIALVLYDEENAS